MFMPCFGVFLLCSFPFAIPFAFHVLVFVHGATGAVSMWEGIVATFLILTVAILSRLRYFACVFAFSCDLVFV